MRDLALRRAANHAPDLPATGECHWCEASDQEADARVVTEVQVADL